MGIRVPKHAGDTDNAAEHSGDIDKTIETPAELREPGARIELPPVELEGISARELGFSKILGLLTYRAGRERIVAVLKYKKLDDAVQRSYTTSLDLDVSGHPLGMYTGAIVGTFLIGLFQAIMRRPRGSFWSSAKAIGRDFSLRFIRGLIATGIAILVLQTTSDIQFPITVTVQDFYGGVILGLFGDQIAQVIQRRISRRRQAA